MTAYQAWGLGLLALIAALNLTAVVLQLRVILQLRKPRAMVDITRVETTAGLSSSFLRDATVSERPRRGA